MSLILDPTLKLVQNPLFHYAFQMQLQLRVGVLALILNLESSIPYGYPYARLHNFTNHQDIPIL